MSKESDDLENIDVSESGVSQQSTLQSILTTFCDFHEDFDVLRSTFAPSLNFKYRHSFDKVSGKDDLKIAVLRSEIEELLDSAEILQRHGKDVELRSKVAVGEDLKARLDDMVERTIDLRNRFERGSGKAYVVDTPRYKVIGNNDRATYHRRPDPKPRTICSAKPSLSSKDTRASQATPKSSKFRSSKQGQQPSAVINDKIKDLELALNDERAALQAETVALREANDRNTELTQYIEELEQETDGIRIARDRFKNRLQEKQRDLELFKKEFIRRNGDVPDLLKTPRSQGRNDILSLGYNGYLQDPANPKGVGYSQPVTSSRVQAKASKSASQKKTGKAIKGSPSSGTDTWDGDAEYEVSENEEMLDIDNEEGEGVKGKGKDASILTRSMYSETLKVCSQQRPQVSSEKSSEGDEEMPDVIHVFNKKGTGLSKLKTPAKSAEMKSDTQQRRKRGVSVYSDYGNDDEYKVKKLKKIMEGGMKAKLTAQDKSSQASSSLYDKGVCTPKYLG